MESISNAITIVVALEILSIIGIGHWDVYANDGKYFQCNYNCDCGKQKEKFFIVDW
jgi:hypothetical protein